jgi:hypothetical protein
MSNELLKSVRIIQPVDVNYPSSGDGVRLDVYQNGKRKYAVLKSPNTYFPDKEDDYKFDKVDRSMSDDDVINEALIILRGIDKNLPVGITVKQMITQDPWKDSPPTKRRYGFTFYYLNDGSQVHIKWLENSFSKGSDFDNASGYIEKTVTYFPYSKSNGTNGLPPDLKDQSDASTRILVKYQRKDGTFDWSDKIESSDELKYSGTLKDSDIIKSVISSLQSQISKFNGTSISDSKLALCDPDTEYCKLIRHVDFNADPPSTTTNDSAIKDIPVSSTQSSDKTKLFLVGLPDKIEIKVGENLPDFSVHVNKIYTPPQYQEWAVIDEEVELDPEYQESSISIEAEQELILQLNAIDDAPVGPSFDELASDGEVDKSVIGSGPVLGSKLTNKSGTSMINLAGHRLTPILKDLQSYLNKNGYPGAKIGNNGVMRDLRSSAYPSSPARAAASLHGAGLAIDVTFNIPGFKWSGIGDNGNLSKDVNLTKVIANFVKGQGDITWGASWGKGSKPSEGVVFARGITEYHHFEIRSDLIPKYWEPVKDELAKFGFKPSDLKSPGTGGNLHKLMLKLLGDTA